MEEVKKVASIELVVHDEATGIGSLHVEQAVIVPSGDRAQILGLLSGTKEPEGVKKTTTTDYDFIARQTTHLSHAYDIAPTKLLQREDELRSLAELCKNDSGYYLYEAEAYSGKSSLLSWFFLHPPVDTWMIGFFIVGQIYLQSDSDAFTEAVKEQLELYLDKSKIAVTAKKSLFELLSEVAEAAQEKGKKLVLIVDALDEEKSKNREKTSILSLLPRWEIPNLIIILSSRPEPRIQDSVCLGNGHPIKNCPVFHLSQLKLSRDFSARAREELRALHKKSQNSKDIVSLLAVASGALTVSDLAELTDEIPIEISSVFEESTARTFRSLSSEFLTTSREYKAYTLAHAALQEQAMQEFVDKKTAQYVEKLDMWCESYRKQKWPVETPAYLISGYLGLLADTSRWDRLADIMIDYNFVSLVSQKSISSSLCFHFIKETIVALSKKKEIDFQRIGLLTETREILALRDSNIPVELPVLFAKLGKYDFALKMTEAISEADRLSSLSQIAVVMAKSGESTRAASTARAVVESIPFEMYPRQRSNFHDYDYAFYLSNCAEAFIVAGRNEEAEAFFNRLIAELNLDERFRHGKHEMMFFHSLREIVIATANAGDLEAALREAELLSFDWQTKGFTLVHLGVLQALRGDFAGALKTAAEAYITNYYNDGTCNEDGRHGNEHITLECAKILLVIDLLSGINATPKGSVDTVLEVEMPSGGEIKRFSYSDLLAQSQIQDYWNKFIGKMYLEIAEAFMSIGRYDDVVILIEKARYFWEKHCAEYKFCDPEEMERYWVDIIKLEVALSRFEQAHRTLQRISENSKHIIDAYTTIARAAYKDGRIEEAQSALEAAMEKTRDCNYTGETRQIEWLMHEVTKPCGAIFSQFNVKSYIAGECQIAEEFLSAGETIAANNIAYLAFGALSVTNEGYVDSDKQHTRKNVFNPIDISKSLFEIGEHELALRAAAVSKDEEWYAKLLMKVALAVIDTDKDHALELFVMALDVIGEYNIEVDVNRKENPNWRNYDYEKDKPTIKDYVDMARALIWSGDKESAKRILPPYSEFSAMLWQSTNLFAFEGLYIYYVLDAKEEIEKDLLSPENSGLLSYAKAWLAVVGDEFREVDFSSIAYSFRWDEDNHALSLNYDDERSDGLKMILKKDDYGLECDADIPAEFYTSLERLAELHEKQLLAELNELIQKLAAPYDGENHYGKQEKWSVQMILLIRKLHALGILEQHESVLSDFEEFLYSDRESVRDNLIWLWVDTLVLIDRPVDEIVTKIKITCKTEFIDEHYNPYRPKIARALTVVLKKHPNHAEATEMLRETCSDFFAYAYSHDSSVFIEAQQALQIDLGLKEAFLSALQEKPWYKMIEVLAYYDLQALRSIARFSIERIEERLQEKATEAGWNPPRLIEMNKALF